MWGGCCCVLGFRHEPEFLILSNFQFESLVDFFFFFFDFFFFFFEVVVVVGGGRGVVKDRAASSKV